MKITPITDCKMGQLIVISELDPSVVHTINQGKTTFGNMPSCVVACVGTDGKLFSPDIEQLSAETLNLLGQTIYLANLMGSGLMAVWPQFGRKTEDMKFYGSWGFIDGNIGNLYEEAASHLQST